LPFINLSSDPEQEYFVDALTDDLTTDLSRITGSFVIARNTAFTYKGKPTDVKQLGRDLGVRYVLEGSARRTGQQVRINAQLIEAETGAHIWADRFEGDRQNLLELQNDVTARIARTLSLEIVQADARRVQRQKSLSLDALDHITLGRALSERAKTGEALEDAKHHFEVALEQGPEAIDALIGLGRALAVSVASGWAVQDSAERLARAEQLLLRALTLDPGNANGYASLGLLRRSQGRLDDAVAACEQALAINPNSSDALRQLAAGLLQSGRPEDAIKLAEHYLRLSPRDPKQSTTYWLLGESHLLLGQTDRAVAFLKQGRQSNSQLWFIHRDLAAALGLQGNLNEARLSLAESLRLRPDLNSLKRLHSLPDVSDLRYLALAKNTRDRGLLMAGLLEE
jgi:adenylate cyclase